MTTYEVTQKIDDLLDKIGEGRPFIRLLLNLLESSIPFELIGEVIDTDHNHPTYLALLIKTRESMSSFVTKLKSVRPRSLFGHLQLLEDDLKKSKEILEQQNEGFISYLLHRLDKFSKAYENFFDHPSSPNTLVMMLSARRLYDSIHTTRNVLSNLRQALQPQQFTAENGKTVSLFLPSTLQYKDMLAKLTAIEVIYSELCQLMNVSTVEHPLQIIRIESGSLWTQIFGESKVIAVFTSLIQSAAAFFYRSYTDEGKISSIPKQISSIESILEFSKKLEEQGVDTSAIKHNMQKSAIIISQQLNNLLQGEPEIKVNDESISPKQEAEGKLLRGRRTLLLNEGGLQNNGDVADDNIDEMP